MSWTSHFPSPRSLFEAGYAQNPSSPQTRPRLIYPSTFLPPSRHLSPGKPSLSYVSTFTTQILKIYGLFPHSCVRPLGSAWFLSSSSVLREGLLPSGTHLCAIYAQIHRCISRRFRPGRLPASAKGIRPASSSTSTLTHSRPRTSS